MHSTKLLGGKVAVHFMMSSVRIFLFSQRVLNCVIMRVRDSQHDDDATKENVGLYGTAFYLKH